MSRPIPIKSPRDAGSSVAANRGGFRTVSHSLPVPASPHFGSLKAPPEFLTGMPPLALPASFQEGGELKKLTKDVLAKSAPAADLAPLHRYRIEEKRKARGAQDGSLSASLGTSMKSASVMASSLVTGMNSLQLEDTIEEGEEVSTPVEARGVVLKSLQEKLGLDASVPREEMEDLDLSLAPDAEDEELQFELS